MLRGSNAYGSGRAAAAAVGVPYILASSGVAVTAPSNDTNENILATVTIPAGAIGANGWVRIQSLWTRTNNANTITLRARIGGIGGTLVLNYGTASVAGHHDIRTIWNRNAQNSQLIHSGLGTGGWGNSGAVATGAIDTSAETTLVLTAQKATGTDTAALEGYICELYYKV